MMEMTLILISYSSVLIFCQYDKPEALEIKTESVECESCVFPPYRNNFEFERRREERSSRTSYSLFVCAFEARLSC